MALEEVVEMIGSRKRAMAALAATLAVTGIGMTAGMPSAAAANGCQTITTNSGSYAQTTAEYAAAWSVQTYGTGVWWYVKHTDGSIQDHGYVDGFVALSEPANIYFLQISASPGTTATACYNG
jgi:hypothetical protein